MLTKYRRIVGATLILPAVLLGSACTKAETGATPGATQASTATAAATSQAAGKTYTDKASFIAALKASTEGLKTAHMTMEMTGQGQELTMEGDSRLDPANPASSFTMSMAGMNLEMLLVDQKIFVKGLPGQDPAKWAALDENSAMGKELASSADQLDPSRMYDEFDKALTDVKHVGPETVDGEEMQKYDLTMDTKSIPDLPTEGGAQLPETLTYTVWLDDKDRMRKVSFEILGMTAVATMSKFDEPVEITAPPADQTVEVSL